MKLCILLLLLLAVGLSAVYAEDLLPKLPPAHPSATQCVEPTDVMRRRHMEFILHQRDETVHRGIRTKRHRLTRCIDCHIQPAADGTYPRHTSTEHFCTTCHEFSSVSIDCFGCHADRPAAAYQKTAAEGGAR